jgi:hypothetical protein
MDTTPHTTPLGPAAHGRPDASGRPASVRYLGFRTTGEGRAYSLRVDGGDAPRLVTITIPHAAFASRQARFQDAPDICFAKLQRELAQNADLPDGLELLVSTAEIDDYRDGQSRRGPERKRRPRPPA